MDANGGPTEDQSATGGEPSLSETAERALSGVHERFGRKAPTSPAEGRGPLREPPVRARQPRVGTVGGPHRVRAAVASLATEAGEARTRATATLRLGDRVARASIESVPTAAALRRGISQATVSALQQLVGPTLQAGVERVGLHVADDVVVVTAVVTVCDDGGDQTLLGAALSRDDPERAVMRATLDALNRHVEPLLRGQDVRVSPDPTATSAPASAGSGC